MYHMLNAFQDSVLSDDELVMVTGGQTGFSGSASTGSGSNIGQMSSASMGSGLNIGQMGSGACDVCGSSIGIFAINISGIGPFVSAFNNITINNGTVY
jgi:hypothetical protein